MKKLFIVLGLCLSSAIWAIEPARTVNLYTNAPAESNGFTDQDEWVKDGHKIHQIATPRIDLYIPSDYKAKMPVLLVCPGGGYRYVSTGNEGVDVANFFCPRGIAIAVLKYRMPNGHENVPLADACRAMELLRDSAQAWNLKSEKIGVMGFSAGGHLAASLMTKYSSKKTRPDYGVLVYPVISTDTTIWHKGTFHQLIGKNISTEQAQAWSLEKQVNDSMPPCLIVACEDDKSVSVENSVRMYQALRDQHVEAELVLVPEGKHGWGFSRQFPKRDLVDAAITQFMYAQLGDKKNSEIVRIYKEQIRREERSKDWAQYYRYQKQNDSIIANNIPVKAVFMGNSITDNWGNWRPEFFQKYNCAARGISGQTSYQMLVRMQSDVIALHPEMVFLLVGTNDVANNNGPISDEHFMDNIRSMCELASLHGIRPMICSILPHRAFRWNHDITGVAERIDRLNVMLKDYAESKGYTYVDYNAVMRAADGGMRDELSADGVHPYKQAYDIMEALVIPYLQESSLSRSEQIRQDLLNANLGRVMVASHRADWRGWPENSLAGIESAIQIGVDIVELDLQETADGQLIIMHDETLNRTTTGKGRISEMTLDSIRHFRLMNGCSIQTNHPIPTLREVLELCKGRVLINLDKADRYFDKVVPLLEETGTTRQIIMKGRKPADEVRQLYGRYLDDVIYMPIVDMDKPESVDQFKEHLKSQPCAFELCFRTDDQYVKQASELAKGKSLIWINTLWNTLCGGHEDDKAMMESADAHYGYLINTLGAHIIQTDRPAFLIDYLKKNNFR